MSPTFNAFSVAQSIKTNIESLNLKLVPIDSYNSKDLENRNENIPFSVHLFPPTVVSASQKWALLDKSRHQEKMFIHTLSWHSVQGWTDLGFLGRQPHCLISSISASQQGKQVSGHQVEPLGPL